MVAMSSVLHTILDLICSSKSFLKCSFKMEPNAQVKENRKKF